MPCFESELCRKRKCLRLHLCPRTIRPDDPFTQPLELKSARAVRFQLDVVVVSVVYIDRVYDLHK